MQLTEARRASSPPCSGCRRREVAATKPGQDWGWVGGGVSVSLRLISISPLFPPSRPPSVCPLPACFSFLLIVSPPFLLSTHVLASVDRFLQAPWPLPHASWPPEAALRPEGGATQPRLVWGGHFCRPPLAWEPEVRLACPQPGGRARAPEGSLSHTRPPDQPVSPDASPPATRQPFPRKPGGHACTLMALRAAGRARLLGGALTSVLHFFPPQPWDRTVIIPVFPDGETEA